MATSMINGRLSIITPVAVCCLLVKAIILPPELSPNKALASAPPVSPPAVPFEVTLYVAV